jgi:hypothetical protein
MQNTAVRTVAEYEAAHAYLLNDVQTFDAAVARADELEPVYYVPLQGYMTRTADDDVRAAWGQVALNVSMAPNVYAGLRTPKAMRNQVIQPVIELEGGGVRAQIPMSDAVRVGIVKPHGNLKNTGLPAQGYTLRDRDTGEILKFGETTRDTARYSAKYLKDRNAEMVFEVSGTKAQMHEWQHQQIIQYRQTHSGQRPRLNQSDY